MLIATVSIYDTCQKLWQGDLFMKTAFKIVYLRKMTTAMDEVLEIEDLIAIGKHNDDVILIIHKRDIDNPDCYAIQLNFKYREYYVDIIGRFLKFNAYDKITDPLVQKSYISKFKQSFSDDVILDILVEYYAKAIHPRIKKDEANNNSNLNITQE